MIARFALCFKLQPQISIIVLTAIWLVSHHSWI